MPSLNALKEFKASFSEIANERKDAAAKNIPFDDLALPKKDAPPFDPSRYGDTDKSAGGSEPAPDGALRTLSISARCSAMFLKTRHHILTIILIIYSADRRLILLLLSRKKIHPV